jgi:hypothetical protein
MDYDMWPLYAISFTMLIPIQPVSAYLTLNLRGLGFDTFETNLLTIPAYVIFIIQLVFWSWYSERINNRMAIVLFYSFWCLPLLLALELLPSNSSPWSWYAVTVLLIGYPYIHSINGMSWPPVNFVMVKLNTHYSQFDFTQCWFGTNPNNWKRSVQYDLSSQLSYIFSCKAFTSAKSSPKFAIMN